MSTKKPPMPAAPKKPAPAKAAPTRAKAKPKATPQPKTNKAATAPDTPVIKRPVKKAPTPKATKPKKVAPKKVDEDADTGDAAGLCGLSVRAARVVDHYLATYKVGESYVAAGYTAKNANVAAACGSRLLNSDKARRYLAIRTKAMMERLEESQDHLLAVTAGVAYGDVNELVEHRVGCCRYCWGAGNKYQFTPNEMQQARDNYEAAVADALAGVKKGEAPPEIPEFDERGGLGFNANNEPNPECPECFGDGRERTIFKDTRNLSPAARSMYAGVEEGKDGKKLKIHDQGKARELLAKVYKLTEDSTNVNISVSADELEAQFGESLAIANARMAAMREERRKMRQQQNPGAAPA